MPKPTDAEIAEKALIKPVDTPIDPNYNPSDLKCLNLAPLPDNAQYRVKKLKPWHIALARDIARANWNIQEAARAYKIRPHHMGLVIRSPLVQDAIMDATIPVFKRAEAIRVELMQLAPEAIKVYKDHLKFDADGMPKHTAHLQQSAARDVINKSVEPFNTKEEAKVVKQTQVNIKSLTLVEKGNLLLEMLDGG